MRWTEDRLDRVQEPRLASKIKSSSSMCDSVTLIFGDVTAYVLGGDGKDAPGLRPTKPARYWQTAKQPLLEATRTQASAVHAGVQLICQSITGLQ